MPATQLAEQLARSVLEVAFRAGGAGARTVQRHTEPTARAVLSTVDQQVTGILQRVAAATFDRLDVPALVRDHVDLDAVVAQVDVEAILARVDLLGLATYIIEGIDLPVIIRESTGGVTTEVLRGARQHSYEADQTVARVIDRMLLRHRGRETQSLNGARHDTEPSV
jgi:hypothetical protein